MNSQSQDSPMGFYDYREEESADPSRFSLGDQLVEANQLEDIEFAKNAREQFIKSHNQFESLFYQTVLFITTIKEKIKLASLKKRELASELGKQLNIEVADKTIFGIVSDLRAKQIRHQG